MATIAEGGLFPPQIDAYIPALNVDECLSLQNIKIPYNVSAYNKLSDIESVHISIIKQSNYKPIFNEQDYPRGIYVINHNPQTYDDILTIPTSVMNISQLQYNVYYKVQIRLSKITCPQDQLTGAALSTYLLNEGNLVNFSEWSTVCLVRFISNPVINLDGNGQAFSSLSTNNIDTSHLIISGNYTKIDHSSDVPASTLPAELKNGKKDLEYLSTYKIQLFNNTNNELIFNSGELEVNRDDPTNIYYDIPYYFNDGDNIKLRLSYTTANLYQDYIDYNIQAHYSSSSWNEQDDIDEVTSIDSMIGKINVSFIPTQDGGHIPNGTVLTIRRGSDLDGFTIWDTIWKKTITSSDVSSISYDDFTIESGVLYKYEIIYTKENVNYTIVEGPVISVFDHAFLTGEGTQLCIKFNPNISSYKHNVNDNIVNTLGGKYPYITRDSSSDYRTFSLSGTIAYEMDVEHQFASRSSMYGEWIDVYGSYFVNRYINQRNDRITQRKFRELVETYLNDDIPKLFRSTPEGNILVRITDVNMTPHQELSRMIYDFSCTATEIGEASIENCKLYQIQDFGEI